MTNDEEQQQSRGFKVQDRRRFTEQGDTKPEESAAPRAEASTASPPPDATAQPSPDSGTYESHEINFSTFVISLGTQALAHLGEIPDPMSKQVTTDLIAARQMIDILGMLRTKTTEGLDKSEKDLLDGLLYDLRLRFVERSKR